MKSQPLNPKTSQATKAYLASPGQSVGLVGDKWLNQSLLAARLAEQLLKVEQGTITDYPYYLPVSSETPSIGIDEIRTISDFISLKVPGNKEIDRIIHIDQADKMTLEAQNALLKNLEEPPHGTIFILTSEKTGSLLPTITSRLHNIHIYKPTREALFNYYSEDYAEADIKQAYLISGGLPGLMDQLLESQASPFNEAVVSAKQLLIGTPFERLSLINDLAKKKSELSNLFFVLKQMAKIGISSGNAASAGQWRKILAATLKGERQLSANVQIKLLLTDFMLDTI